MTANNPVLEGSNILGKKFDIRQWVLMTPSQCYIFSHFYAKICSKNYDIHSANDPQIHLANYTLNKTVFTEKDLSASVCSEKQLQ